MTSDKEYFIHLLYSFANRVKPDAEKVDWQEILRLSNIHDVQGIVANQIKFLPQEYQPDKELKSIFSQLLGRTVQKSVMMDDVLCLMEDFFNSNKIDHLYVKGASIRGLYPDKELRTSGDIDVIVRDSEYERIVDVMKKAFSLQHYHYDTSIFLVNEISIEVHRDADVYTDYFDDIFSLADKDGYRYSLGEYDTLFYVICHLLKHLKYQGAGIRMFLDIDVIIRSIHAFSLDKLMTIAKESGVYNSVLLLISLTKEWFNTPIDSALLIKIDDDTKGLFYKIVIDGGSFGFEVNSLGQHYLAENVSGEKIGAAARAKALLRLVFPSAEYVRKYYTYSSNHPVLTPVAYVNRIFDGIFKRGKHSAVTVSQIVSYSKISQVQANLIRELDL